MKALKIASLTALAAAISAQAAADFYITKGADLTVGGSLTSTATVGISGSDESAELKNEATLTFAANNNTFKGTVKAELGGGFELDGVTVTDGNLSFGQLGSIVTGKTAQQTLGGHGVDAAIKMTDAGVSGLTVQLEGKAATEKDGGKDEVKNNEFLPYDTAADEEAATGFFDAAGAEFGLGAAYTGEIADGITLAASAQYRFINKLDGALQPVADAVADHNDAVGDLKDLIDELADLEKEYAAEQAEQSNPDEATGDVSTDDIEAKKKEIVEAYNKVNATTAAVIDKLFSSELETLAADNVDDYGDFSFTVGPFTATYNADAATDEAKYSVNSANTAAAAKTALVRDDEAATVAGYDVIADTTTDLDADTDGNQGLLDLAAAASVTDASFEGDVVDTKVAGDIYAGALITAEVAGATIKAGAQMKGEAIDFGAEVAYSVAGANLKASVGQELEKDLTWAAGVDYTIAGATVAANVNTKLNDDDEAEFIFYDVSAKYAFSQDALSLNAGLKYAADTNEDEAAVITINADAGYNMGDIKYAAGTVVTLKDGDDTDIDSHVGATYTRGATYSAKFIGNNSFEENSVEVKASYSF